jgi:bifunctional UDP-N-acetylglucosamine pyrophosphorylase/glucosamine-1-phosphate N-acetyltransferase
MRSKLPKVLHPLAGKPMLQWVLDAAYNLQPAAIEVVYGHGGETVCETIPGKNISWVLQTEQLGTGHAVQQAMQHVAPEQQLLVLYGDTPLINPQTLQQLVSTTPAGEVGIITADFSDPFGLGRIVRDSNHGIIGIVEQKDATVEQQTITEINTGIMLLPARKLQHWLSQLQTNNAQGELYLTDVIAMAVADGVPIHSIQPKNNSEVSGVNTRVQLSQLERAYQSIQAEAFMAEGVTIMDPARFDVRGELTCGEDVTIDINVIIEGKVSIGAGCKIGANVILKNVSLAANTEILPNCILEQSTLGENCLIGPFARLRPGTELANNVKVGNYVETKKARVGEGSKIPHLSYIGDAVIGKSVNIGAGVITANYDGVNKHKTIIGDHVFVGCDTQLIAPVNIGDNAFIGCGSSISKNAPAGKLTIARARQTTLASWQPPKKS